MPSVNFYPSISSLVSVKSIPMLDYIPVNSQTLLDGLFYRDLQIFRDPERGLSTYHLTIIIGKGIDFKIPGIEGFDLSVNKAPGETFSAFEVEFHFYWKLLSFYKKIFKIENFDWTPNSIANLLLGIFNLKKENLLSTVISEVVEIDEIDADPITVFVDLFNNENPNNTIIYNEFPTLQETVNDLFIQIEDQDIDILTFILNTIIKNDPETIYHKLEKLVSKNLVITDLKDDLKDIIIPEFWFGIKNVQISLSFPTSILVPIDEDNQIIPNEKARLTFLVGGFKYGTKKAFEFNDLSSFDFSRSLIPNLGLYFEVLGLKVDLSKTQNIPEADKDERPADFIGVFITEATIGFPANFQHDPDDDGNTAEIKARNLLIGTGGISGTISMEAKDLESEDVPLVKIKLGENFNISLDAFSITFQQNAIINSIITGTLTVPGFKRKNEAGTAYIDDPVVIDIEAFIGNNGEFKISAAPVGGLHFYIENVAKISVISLSLGQQDDKYYIEVAGSIDFTELKDQIKGLDTDFPTNIPIKRLRVWENGKVEFDAGVILLPKAISLKVGPAKIAVTSLGFSSIELFHKQKKRQYNVIAFDGSLDINPGGVSVRGEGIKICYTIDHNNIEDEEDENYRPFHAFLRVEGIGLEITVPSGAKISEADFYLKGFLAIKSPPKAAEGEEQQTKDTYSGEIAFAINKAKIQGSASMDYNPNIPSWLVDASVMLSTGIPLGSTGLAIYGFRGLAGKSKRFDKQEDETWWKLYKRPTQGINRNKFKDGKGLAIGLGVALATQSDSGKSFSSILMLMLGLPDVIMLQGHATFMEERVTFQDPDPPFSALLAIDKHSIQTGLGVNYLLPEDGSIVNLKAEAEMAYFWKNSRAWYINFGKDLPETERMRAKVLSIIDAYAYLMISASGIKTGAGASWKFAKNIGPVGVGAEAYMDTYGRISFRPVQVGGGISIGGNAYANISKFKLGFDLAAYLEAEAPKPFQIKGGVDVQLTLPKPLKSKGVHLEFAWMFEKDKDDKPLPLLGGSEGIPVPATAVNMLTSESFPVTVLTGTSADPVELGDVDLDELPVIPMDSFIDIEFVNPPRVWSDTEFTFAPEFSEGRITIQGEVTAPDNRSLVPPQKGLSEQVKHELELSSVQIYAWNGTDWKPYNIYEASETITTIPDVVTKVAGEPTYLKNLPQAYWQLKTPNKNSHLRVMAQNMFSYMNQAHPGSITTERLGYEGGVVFCEQTKISTTCVNWDNEAINTIYEANKAYNKEGVRVTVFGKDGTVKTITNSYSLTNGLEFTEVEGMEFQFVEPQSVVKPKLKVGTGNYLHVEYFKKEVTGTDHNDLPVYKYTSVVTHKLSSSQVTTYTGYESATVPVFKVRISLLRNSMLNAAHDSVLRIGYHTYTANTSWYDSHDSIILIDEVTIIGKGLDTTEVDDVFNNGYSGGNVIAQWDLNGSGNDTSGNSYNGTGTVSPTPVAVQGRTGSANEAYYLGKSSFSGSTPRHFQVSHASELGLGKENFTVAAWIKVPTVPFSYVGPIKDYWYVGRRHIVSKFKNTDGGYNLGIDGWLDADTKEPKTGLSFQYKLNNSSGYIANYSVECKDFMDGNWHHVAVVRTFGYISDLGVEGPAIDLYVDGVWLSRQAFYTGGAVASSDNASIHQFCFLDQESHLLNLKVPSQSILNTQNDKMLDGLTKIVQPIWRPGTKYAIKVNGKDIVDGDNKQQSFIIAFRTSGATGFFTKPDVPQDADDFLLGRIKGYIDYKHSYPNAEGKILASKPLFYTSPSLHLFYNSPYMHLMFDAWDDYQDLDEQEYRLEAQIMDAKGSNSGEPLMMPEWHAMQEKLEGQDMATLNSLLKNGPDCWNHDTDQEMRRLTHRTEYVLPDLIPNNMYSVTYYVNNVQDTEADPVEVHKHVFQTSRYPDFEAQVKSYTTEHTEIIPVTQLIEDFEGGAGSFAAHTGSTLTQGNMLYVESALDPGAKISFDVIEGMAYAISFDLIGVSFNKGGEIRIYCKIGDSQLFTNSIISQPGAPQQLVYDFTADTTGTIEVTMMMENHNLGQKEYFIIDNFDVSIPAFSKILVSEDFDGGSTGEFTSSNGSAISNSSDVLHAENINDPKCTRYIDVIDGFDYTVIFKVTDTSSNGAGPADIFLNAGGIDSYLQLMTGMSFPVVITLTFTSNTTGTIPIDISFSSPTTLGSTEYIEIDDFQVTEFLSSDLSIADEDFNSGAGAFVPVTFTSFAPTGVLYVQGTSVPRVNRNVDLEADSKYSLSFDLRGRSYNAGNADIVCTIGSIATETLTAATGTRQTVSFTTTDAVTEQISIALDNNSSGVQEYLIIDNLKLTRETTLNTETDALFTINAALDATALEKAADILLDASDQDATLVNQFGLKYDRILFGALNALPALQPSTNTEINKIINTNTGKLIGLLLRNPEPFFVAGLEEVDLQDSLTISGSGIGDGFIRVFSADRSCIFISNEAMDLLSGEYNFNFQFLEYNGTEYIVEPENEVSLTVMI